MRANPRPAVCSKPIAAPRPGPAPILLLHQHLRTLIQALGEVLPNEWDEADLQAWEEYQAKHARSGSPEAASPTGPRRPKKTTPPKNTKRKR